MDKEKEQELNTRPDPLKRINVIDEKGKERRLQFSVDAKEIVANGGKYASEADEKMAASVNFRKV